ncbi:surface layer protein [Desulfocucumis palustris]|uniref:Surface layer protein n=1 Tax=Desulfocucumis palustris TaxID=1898651 RepID=A0A2L2XBU7_9FIRM|nr:hypothetical protein [Desulfocucumis palustris]GBF33464.1 surface layer protein [Desulfocucumis palustris]
MSQIIFTYESIFADTFVQLVSHPLPGNAAGSVTELDFQDGVREVENLSVRPMEAVANFSVVEFKLSIPFEARLSTSNKDNPRIEGALPDIHVKVLIYTPLVRQEALPDLKAETRCQMLVEPSLTGGMLQFAVNVNIVVRCSDKHQLSIPSMLSSRGQKNEDSLQTSWVKACEKFVDPQRTSFPDDFFPHPGEIE